MSRSLPPSSAPSSPRCWAPACSSRQDTQDKIDKIFRPRSRNRAGRPLWQGIRGLEDLGRELDEGVRRGLTSSLTCLRAARIAARQGPLLPGAARTRPSSRWDKVMSGKNVHAEGSPPTWPRPWWARTATWRPRAQKIAGLLRAPGGRER